ncbi:hypothetical protein ZWY2020_042615 [Hordeum vulgare]|nr:hypothetical protein ZWY2020_042615 [Hordeum vulgare]
MKETQQKPRPSGSTAASSVRAVLQDFLKQQQRLDAQRQEAATRRSGWPSSSSGRVNVFSCHT